MQYRSANTPDKRDVLGAWMRGLLAGHQRYTHITALRADALAAQALDMNRVVSKDALRRALERINEAASTAWMAQSCSIRYAQALNPPWVQDIDTTIKPLYRPQEDVELAYNPTYCVCARRPMCSAW